MEDAPVVLFGKEPPKELSKLGIQRVTHPQLLDSRPLPASLQQP